MAVPTDPGPEKKVYYSCAFPIILVVYLVPSILDYVLPRNEPYPKTMLVPAEYFIDQEKYFNIIFLHISMVITMGLSVVIASDTLFNVFVYHACGLFKVASHRLEEIFDACQDEDEKLNKRMASVQTRIMLAVEWHKNATEFTEDIVAAYGMFYFMSLVPLLCAISVTLYCAAKYLQQHELSVLPLIYTVTQMAHILFMVIPAQKLTDYSAEIPFKAYSGLWYAAPSKKQTSILLVIQRGLRPSVIVTGKMLVASLETYLGVMQSCVSYCMVFLSIG